LRALQMKSSIKMKYYKIIPTEKKPEKQGNWDGAVWRQAKTLAVDCFRPEGSDHRPETFCRLLYDERAIYGIFRVYDQYVRCIRRNFQDDVWKDSCVEFFVQPERCAGYFNFEFNCGGAMLASYVTDSTRIDGRLKRYIPLDREDEIHVERYASLPEKVEPEITKQLIWMLEFAVPFKLLKKYAGEIGKIKGKTWRANFYKCGNETSHPHWASWAPLKARNFHNPENFGQITFFE
jgi:hypothetical protein